MVRLEKPNVGNPPVIVETSHSTTPISYNPVINQITVNFTHPALLDYDPAEYLPNQLVELLSGKTITRASNPDQPEQAPKRQMEEDQIHQATYLKTEEIFSPTRSISTSSRSTDSSIHCTEQSTATWIKLNPPK